MPCGLYLPHISGCSGPGGQCNAGILSSETLSVSLHGFRLDDQDIFYSPVFKAVQDGQPVLGAFVFSDLDRKDILLSFTVDPENDIGSKLSDDSVAADRIVDRIDINYRINVVKRPGLPLLDLGINATLKVSHLSIKR